MNRTRTYSEFKKLLNTELEMFNFCLSTNTIFKSEFTKLRKMFKGLLRKEKLKKNECYIPNNPNYKEFIKIEKAFDTYINYNGHYIPFSQITDFNLHLFQFDYPNLQEQYDKLLSMKKSIRLGKRPKDLEKDYEAERLKKAAEEDKATCGICNQYWELVDIRDRKNIIHDHGFTIRPGFRSGVCFGARYECWEKSPESKKEYVRVILRPALKKVIKEEPTLATVQKVNDLIVERSNKFKAYYKLSYDERKKTERPEKPEYKLSGQQIGADLPLDKEIDLEFLTKVWYDWKIHLKTEITRFETVIKNWKLQPTPREKLGKENQ